MTTLNTLIVKRDEIQSKIDSIQSSIDELKGCIDNFEYTCSDSEFDEILDQDDEQHTSVGTFYPSVILKSCDPVAYRCAKSDYESNCALDDIEEYNDLKQELEDLENQLEELEGKLEELESELEDLQDEIYSKSESRLNGLYWAESDNSNMLSFKTQDELYAFLNNQ